jgi:hypothetical protein
VTIINNEGRFVLLEKPLAFPFHDIVNQAPEGPVFDLGVDLEFKSGVVYITADHVEEMAKTLGMIHGEEVEHLHNRIKELEEEKNRLPEGVDELVSGINQLVVDYNQRAVLGTIGHELSDVPVPSDNGTEKKSDADRNTVSKSDKTDGQSSGASKRKGTNELPSNSVDEFGFNL